jgi:hypothetical protein
MSRTFPKLNDLLKLSRQFSYLRPLDKGEVAIDHTKGIYEDAWGRALGSVKKRIEDNQPMPHIVLSMENRSNLTRAGMGGRVNGPIATQLLDFHNIPKSKSGVPVARVGVVNGRYALVPNIDPVEMILAHVKAGVKNLVELGSGRGNNLFKLSMLLGNHAKKLRFFALEYTEAGQDITRRIAAIEPGLDMNVRYFNYMEPDISMVPDDGTTLFFSVHSIEQVARISPKLYDQILARKHTAVVLHFEPVGWQRNPTILAQRKAGNIDFFNSMVAHRLDDIESEECQIMNAAIHSWRNGYNINLFEMIYGYQKAGKLRVGEIIYDFTSNNPVNPTTYIKIFRAKDMAKAKDPILAVLQEPAAPVEAAEAAEVLE